MSGTAGNGPKHDRMADQTGGQTDQAQSPSTKWPRVPDNIRVYAIGDLHGRADLMAEMLQRIAADSSTATQVNETVLVFLGDYIDRGPDSAGVIDQALRLMNEARYTTHLLKGNHEVMLLDFLDDADRFFHWAANGGVETLESYGVDVDAMRNETPERLRQTALAAIPDAHLTLFRGLKTSVAIGDYLCVHAGVRPGIALDAQAEHDLIWIREPFLDHEGDFGRYVVHGHTPVSEPDIRTNRMDIDTLAWRSGTLTTVVLEGASRRFLQT